VGNPFIRITNLSRESIYIDLSSLKFVELPDGLAEGRRTQLQDGDILISITADIGLIGYVDQRLEKPAYINQHLALVRVDPTKANSKFVSYFWASERSQRLFRGLTDQGAKAGMSLEKLRGLKLVSPEPDEQRAIGAALSDVDALIGSLDKVIAKKRAIKFATMQQLLTGKTRLPGFGGHAATASSTNDSFPSDWKVLPLGTLGMWRGGLTPSMADPKNWVGGEIPWISSSDVRGNEIVSTGACITRRAVENTAVPRLPSGSIVVVMRSGILRRFLPVARITREMAINQDIKALPASPSFDSRFLQQTITFRQNDILASCMKPGTTVESIDTSWFRAFEIGMPDANEQKAIANVLSDMDAEIAALERRHNKARGVKQGMMQQLLTGRNRLIKPETRA
jgi:type I restriction enzyme S subunit